MVWVRHTIDLPLDVRCIKKGNRPFQSDSPGFTEFLLAEVAGQQAFKSLAVAGLVAGHFVHGIMDGVQVQFLGQLGQVELARHENRLFAALRAAKRLIFFASRGTNTPFPDSTLGKPVNTGTINFSAFFRVCKPTRKA